MKTSVFQLVAIGGLLAIVGCGQRTAPPKPTAQDVGSAKDAVFTVRYQAPESPDDRRNDYHNELLKVALDRTVDEYGPYKMTPARFMNELRFLKKLENGDPEVDILQRPTSIEDEKRLTPVRIPLDKGLLGYRVCLIRKVDQAKFSTIKTLEELKQFTAGQGRDWNDVAIYEHNGVKVHTGSDYEGLFEMLCKERFDYFPRGVEEAWLEWNSRKEKLPALHVEEALLIHYPFARYFWVPKSPKGDLLRERLTKGLEAMIKDGSFDKLFWKYKADVIRKSAVKGRRVIEITNPFLPDTVPLNRPELWYDPLTQDPPARIDAAK